MEGVGEGARAKYVYYAHQNRFILEFPLTTQFWTTVSKLPIHTNAYQYRLRIPRILKQLYTVIPLN